MPGLSPPTGLDLSTLIAGGWKDLLSGEFWVGTGANAVRVTKGSFIPWEQRMLRGRRPAFTLRNDALYFLGPQVFYARFSLFRLVYTPKPRRT